MSRWVLDDRAQPRFWFVPLVCVLVCTCLTRWPRGPAGASRVAMEIPALTSESRWIHRENEALGCRVCTYTHSPHAAHAHTYRLQHCSPGAELRHRPTTRRLTGRSRGTLAPPSGMGKVSFSASPLSAQAIQCQPLPSDLTAISLKWVGFQCSPASGDRGDLT